MSNESFLNNHFGTIIVGIGGAFAAVMTYFTTRTSTVSAMQKTLQEGFKTFADMQSARIAILEAKLAETEKDCDTKIAELTGRVRALEQRNLSLVSILRANNIDIPRATTTEVVFMPFPGESYGDANSN